MLSQGAFASFAFAVAQARPERHCPFDGRGIVGEKQMPLDTDAERVPISAGAHTRGTAGRRKKT